MSDQIKFEPIPIGSCYHHPIDCHCNDERDSLKMELQIKDNFYMVAIEQRDKAYEELERLSGKTEFCGQCEQYARELEKCSQTKESLLAQMNLYKAALKSIAENSCCTSCREAGLVAKEVLSQQEGEKK